jgi:hypothetical protein
MTCVHVHTIPPVAHGFMVASQIVLVYSVSWTVDSFGHAAITSGQSLTAPLAAALALAKATCLTVQLKLCAPQHILSQKHRPAEGSSTPLSMVSPVGFAQMVRGGLAVNCISSPRE